MDLEKMTLVYSSNVAPETLGKVIFGLYSRYNPSKLGVVQEEKMSNGYSRHYSIYVPTEEYELNMGIC